MVKIYRFHMLSGGKRIRKSAKSDPADTDLEKTLKSKLSLESSTKIEQQSCISPFSVAIRKYTRLSNT